MRIIDYKYIHGSVNWNGYVAIPELDRTNLSAGQFIKLAEIEIVLTRPTAFLYIDGYSISPSDSGLSAVNSTIYLPAVKLGSSYTAHEWIYTFKNPEYLVKLDIMSGTCAAGIQAIHEAARLITDGVEEVIIIGGERITPDTIRMFRELHIPITCGDGFVYMRLEAGFDVVHSQWEYAYNRNPFMFTRENLDNLNPGYEVDFVKLHGTGTQSNTTAEAGLSELGIPLIYKNEIGHTQGVSALIETCMVLDDPSIKGNILVTANGLGGYYGAFTLIKK